jgi:hypothetical protein
VPGWASFSFAFGPVVAFAALLVVIALLRRTFRSNRAGLTDDDVLAPLLGPHTWADVNRVAFRLRRAGIRHRIADLGGGYQLLVPADDLAAARGVMNRVE